ncbi:MAG: (d)CMP kinase [Candidatus Omnitrophota bacterium]|nr:(d)CMP kinase [Candidatus Omnitrophota bacterium]
MTSRYTTKRPRRLILAVDGPAGSGKSTVSKILAMKLGLLYIDTGAMYRALTLKATRSGMNLEDEDVLTKLAHGTKIDLKESIGGLKVLLDGEDVSGLIRTPELTDNVRYIAKVPGVRKEMVRMQRAIGENRGAVLEGRDIGTVVFPDARYKFYLDADEKVRVKRRYDELMGMGQKVGMGDIKKAVSSRDASDIKRAVGALKKADDAVYIDTTELSINEVVDKILLYIGKWGQVHFSKK